MVLGASSALARDRGCAAQKSTPPPPAAATVVTEKPGQVVEESVETVAARS
jgi:hypothetical protein